MRLFSGYMSAVRQLAFSADGGRLLTRSALGTVQVWDRLDGKPEALLKNQSNWVQDAIFTASGRVLVVGYSGSDLRRWTPDEGHRDVPLALRGVYSVLTRGSRVGGRTLAWINGTDGATTFGCWAPGSEELLWEIIVRPEGRFSPNLGLAVVSPDGSTCAGASNTYGQPQPTGHTIFRWDTQTGRELPAFGRHGLELYSPLCLSHDGRAAAVAAGSAVALLEPGSAPRQTTSEDGSPVRALAFSPDGSRLAGGTLSGRVTVWETADLRLIITYDWDIKEIQSLAFAPDGLRLAAGGDWGQIVVWDLE